MRPKKFRPKASQAESLVGTRLVYSPVSNPLWSVAQNQRLADSYGVEAPGHDSMRGFHLKQKILNEALALKVGEEVTVTGYLGQGGSWPPLFRVVFSDGLSTLLGVAELTHPA